MAGHHGPPPTHPAARCRARLHPVPLPRPLQLRTAGRAGHALSQLGGVWPTDGRGPDRRHPRRVLLLVTESYRHGKAIGGWSGAEGLLETAGITTAPAGQRAWDRFPADL
ncbi:hypothetical protein OG749_40890 [Streptomyces nojiriensis]